MLRRFRISLPSLPKELTVSMPQNLFLPQFLHTGEDDDCAYFLRRFDVYDVMSILRHVQDLRASTQYYSHKGALDPAQCGADGVVAVLPFSQ